MIEMLTGVAVALGVILAFFIGTPWLILGMEVYWSWCWRLQRRIKERRKA